MVDGCFGRVGLYCDSGVGLVDFFRGGKVDEVDDDKEDDD